MKLSAGSRALAVMVAFVAILAGPAVARAAAPQPYGTNDFGGFRNILPPGENGLVNTTLCGASARPTPSVATGSSAGDSW